MDDPEGLLATQESLDLYRDRIEWIVVDGGSSYDVCGLLRSNPPEVLVSEPDQGPYDGMNKGAALANCPFVIFMNGGDRLANNGGVGSLLVELAEYDDRTIVVGGAVYCFGDGRKRVRRPFPAWYLHHGLPTIHQALVYPSVIWVATEYDLSFRVAADYALTAWAWRNGYIFRRKKRLILAEFAVGGLSFQSGLKLEVDARRVQAEILGTPLVVRAASSLLRRVSARRLERSLGSGQS